MLILITGSPCRNLTHMYTCVLCAYIAAEVVRILVREASAKSGSALPRNRGTSKPLGCRSIHVTQVCCNTHLYRLIMSAYNCRLVSLYYGCFLARSILIPNPQPDDPVKNRVGTAQDGTIMPGVDDFLKNLMGP